MAPRVEGEIVSRTRRFVTLSVSLAVVALSTVACSGAAGTPGSTFTFRVSKVTVVNHNDSLFYGVRDEPFVHNLWFRVKAGVANSAQVGIAGDRANAYNDLGNGQSHAYVGGEQAPASFSGVRLLDVADLLNPANPLEIVGTWTWEMDQDDVSVLGVAVNTLNVVKNALNLTVAAGTVPTDANALVGQLLGNFGDAFNLIAGALFASIPGIPDDPIGSRFYVGVAATGVLAAIIDGANAVLPSVAIPIITVPPDIGGGRIFSLGHNSTFTGEVMDQGNGRHDIDVQVIDLATVNHLPTASFATTATSGTAPLTITLDGSTSTDSDGTVTNYDWNFGDFTSGSGALTGHTFTSSGTFPVTLTVTDNRGDSSSSTINVAVGGAPTVAPTSLQLAGSGCCNTYGDFAWAMVPGATNYQIDMGAFFGGGCLIDASSVINGQTSHGRVQDALLCLGSRYDVRIRAKANGLWGPWSPTTRLTL